MIIIREIKLSHPSRNLEFARVEPNGPVKPKLASYRPINIRPIPSPPPPLLSPPNPQIFLLTRRRGRAWPGRDGRPAARLSVGRGPAVERRVASRRRAVSSSRSRGALGRPRAVERRVASRRRAGLEAGLAAAHRVAGPAGLGGASGRAREPPGAPATCTGWRIAASSRRRAAGRRRAAPGSSGDAPIAVRCSNRSTARIEACGGVADTRRELASHVGPHRVHVASTFPPRLLLPLANPSLQGRGICRFPHRRLHFHFLFLLLEDEEEIGSWRLGARCIIPPALLLRRSPEQGCRGSPRPQQLLLSGKQLKLAICSTECRTDQEPSVASFSLDLLFGR
ncbi:hypothetical protein DAI22_04g295400 [Oryza sativa Japonica Group]|nr:hypothetical protein DAI22_04g295400 [Oryza sativa Japonica Group]